MLVVYSSFRNISALLNFKVFPFMHVTTHMNRLEEALNVGTIGRQTVMGSFNHVLLYHLTLDKYNF